MELCDFSVRNAIHQSVEILYQTIMFSSSVRNKQQFNDVCVGNVPLIRHIDWEYCFVSITKYINIDVHIISLKFSYNRSIGSNRKFYSAPIEFLRLFINLLVILWGLLSVGFNTLVIHHLKHSLSSFFILIIAFLLPSSTGNEMYELP